MKTSTCLSAVALCALLATSTTALAQSSTMPATPADTPNAPRQSDRQVDREARQAGNNNQLARADRNFFEEAAKSGMKEVEVSNAVKARLADAQVKAFADTMVADHTAANSELQALASKKGVVLPVERKDFASKWADNNHNLDKDYVKAMEDDHEEAVKLFEKASKSEDADIAAFARKTLPKLQEHLTHVRTLKRTLK
jgi:putative membrane protein